MQRNGDQWSVKSIEDLGTGNGKGINTVADVVGSDYWLIDGTSGSLPGYRGGSPGTAYDISDSRWVVGSAFKREYDAPRATLWMLR